MTSKTLCAAVALTALAAFATPATAAGPEQQFSSAVEQILMSQQDGPIAQLNAEKKHEMVSCVNQVLDGLTPGTKRHILEGGSFDEIEHRFGEVVMANQAEWKQKIARSCAHIVISA